MRYSERFRGKFYNPTNHLVFESENAKFFEDNEFILGDTIKDKDVFVKFWKE
jgi:hypothetical protein